jgi:hypothetical protein
LAKLLYFSAKALLYYKLFIFCNNKTKFVSLKRLLPILSFILLTAIYAPVHANTGVPEAAAKADPILRFYPNPATAFINFDFQQGFDKGYSIQVYSFLGKKMYEQMNINQRTTLNLNEFNRGVYIYQLRDRSGKVVESGKFQVSK